MILTKEEIEILKNNPDTAALGLKLEESKFIPKERFDEVNESNKSLTAKLSQIEQEHRKANETLTSKEKEFAELNVLYAGAKANEEKFFDSQKKTRESALAKISDTKLKEIAERLPSVDDVVLFVETIEQNKIKTFSEKRKQETEHKGFVGLTSLEQEQFIQDVKNGTRKTI